MADLSGIQELIDQLKIQGVGEGQRQADQIIKEAQNKASRLISDAKAEADRLLADAHQKIEVERASAHEAIKMAYRDSTIALRSEFKNAFSAYLKRLVSLELRDKEFLRQFILALAGAKSSQVAQAPQAEILVPEQLFQTKEGKKQLQHLVLGITHDMLKEGVELNVSGDFRGGIKVRIVGKDLEIDLTEEAISALLLKYLLPRYREIVSGELE